jgi:hypothetical protein
MTVDETVQFLRDADGLMSDPDRARLVEFVGANPEVGDLMPETGGVRKLRWALPGRGKRGGARVIYFFHDERLPVFLLAMYGKSEKANLSKAEQSMMAKVVSTIVQATREVVVPNDKHEETGQSVCGKESSHSWPKNHPGTRGSARLVKGRRASGPSHTCAGA